VHSDFLGKLVQADAIYRMREFTDRPDGLSEEEMNDFLPGLLRAATWQDTLYALPMEATLLALLYNKDHFRDAGLDPNRPPQTWDELRTYAERLTVDPNGDGVVDRYGFYVPVFPASGPLNIWMNLQWSTFLWQAGGDIINEEQTEVLYDSPAGAQALGYWRDLYRMMGSPANSITHDLSFVSRNVSMIMDGPWDLPRFRKIDNFDWGIAPLPAGPARQVTYIAGEHLAIFKQSPNADSAWTFVKWVVQPEIQAMFSKDSGYLPVRQSSVRLPEYQEHLATDERLRAFVEQISIGQVRLPIDYYHVEINRHIAEAIERSLIGGVNPQASLEEAAAKSNLLLKGAGS
jgi:ABC-type glycerol-3-phosphate transport system substrate-binding protein